MWMSTGTMAWEAVCLLFVGGGGTGAQSLRGWAEPCLIAAVDAASRRCGRPAQPHRPGDRPVAGGLVAPQLCRQHAGPPPPTAPALCPLALPGLHVGSYHARSPDGCVSKPAVPPFFPWTKFYLTQNPCVTSTACVQLAYMCGGLSAKGVGPSVGCPISE